MLQNFATVPSQEILNVHVIYQLIKTKILPYWATLLSLYRESKPGRIRNRFFFLWWLHIWGNVSQKEWSCAMIFFLQKSFTTYLSWTVLSNAKRQLQWRHSNCEHLKLFWTFLVKIECRLEYFVFLHFKNADVTHNILRFYSIVKKNV